jgi:hypothetical protein
MNIPPKKGFIIIWGAFIFAALCVVGFNLFVDPYCVFSKSYRNNRVDGKQYNGNSRYNEYYRMELGDCQASTVILGGSRSSAFIINEQNAKYETVIFYGARTKDYYEYCSYLIRYNKKIKQIFLQIDIDMFTPFKKTIPDSGSFLHYSPKVFANISFIWSNLFNIDANTFKTILSSISREVNVAIIYNKKYYKSIHSDMEKQASFSTCDFNKISDDYSYMKKTIEICNQYGIQYTFFFCPDSYVRLDAMNEQQIDDVKRSLVSLTPFVDLFFYSPFTRNLPNYSDAHHFLKAAARTVWSAISLRDSDISMYITQDNIEQCLGKQAEYSQVEFDRSYYP